MGSSDPLLRFHYTGHVGLRLVWEMLGRCFPRDGKRLEMRVLTIDNLVVPDTNPRRGPHRTFVDGECSGNLLLGQRIGDEEV